MQKKEVKLPRFLMTLNATIMKTIHMVAKMMNTIVTRTEVDLKMERSIQGLRP